MKLTINGMAVTANAGDTILEAARRGGIEIPTLCYHPDLSIDGSCRMCVVRVAGLGHPVSACTHAVAEGMVVETETPELRDMRRNVLQLLLNRYADGGYSRGAAGETEFERYVAEYGLTISAVESPPKPVNSDPNPFVWVDWNKCILCTRCVRACDEIQCRFVWGVGGKGSESAIVAGLGTSMLEARCESCGACAAYCPTGALDDKMSIGKGAADSTTTTVCGYCGVGCSLQLHVRENRIIRATSSPASPVNGMHLCVKGRYGYDFVHHPERLRSPRVRRYLLDGGQKPDDRGPGWQWVETDWETALAIVSERLTAMHREGGGSAVGFLSSAKCTNEDNYLMQKLARQVFETNNVDHCARLCHASTVAGLAMAFGSGAMSNSMDDVAEQAAAFFVIGSNTTEQHPVFGSRIRRAVIYRNVPLIVADPRRIDLTELATVHLQQRPGTDVALLNGIMHLILKNGHQDADFISQRCEGYDEFAATIERYPPEKVTSITGVPESQLRKAAEILGTRKPAAVIWAMGITQHTTGVLNVLSLANLQMLLGNMGVPGGGVNPLRGQNNVQGACDMGALANVYPGYQRVSDAEVRRKFVEAWALEPCTTDSASPRIPENPGLTVVEMVEAFDKRQLRGLYILGEDPAMTDPNVNHVRECLQSGEFLVLQEIFPSETSHFADVLLPGVSFAEKKGTFTNTERRIQLVRPAIDPEGLARPDWRIIADVASSCLTRMQRRPVGPHAGWGYSDPSEIMQEIAALTPSYAGVGYERLEQGERLQWPVWDSSHAGTPILHTERFTRGLGRFHPVDHLPPDELPDSQYPLYLTTGRVLYHWHGGELTRRTSGLLAIYPEPLVEVSHEDASRIGLKGKKYVRVVSRRGTLVARAAITERVPQGVVFGNFHFPGRHNVNNLTNAALDPVAKIPEYKVCAVRIEAVDKAT